MAETAGAAAAPTARRLNADGTSSGLADQIVWISSQAEEAIAQVDWQADVETLFHGAHAPPSAAKPRRRWVYRC